MTGVPVHCILAGRRKTTLASRSESPAPNYQAQPLGRRIDQYPYSTSRRKFKRRYRECPGGGACPKPRLSRARALPINANGFTSVMADNPPDAVGTTCTKVVSASPQS